MENEKGIARADSRCAVKTLKNVIGIPYWGQMLKEQGE